MCWSDVVPRRFLTRQPRSKWVQGQNTRFSLYTTHFHVHTVEWIYRLPTVLSAVVYTFVKAIKLHKEEDSLNVVPFVWQCFSRFNIFGSIRFVCPALSTVRLVHKTPEWHIPRVYHMNLCVIVHYPYVLYWYVCVTCNLPHAPIHPLFQRARPIFIAQSGISAAPTALVLMRSYYVVRGPKLQMRMQMFVVNCWPLKRQYSYVIPSVKNTGDIYAVTNLRSFQITLSFPNYKCRDACYSRGAPLVFCGWSLEKLHTFSKPMVRGKQQCYPMLKNHDLNIWRQYCKMIMKFRLCWGKELRHSWNDSAKTWYLYRATRFGRVAVFLDDFVRCTEGGNGCLVYRRTGRLFGDHSHPPVRRNVDRS